MKRVLLTRQAEFDLFEIWLWIAQQSEDAADRFTDRLRARIDWLAASPGAGRVREDLQRPYRSFNERGYLIFYMEDADGIVIRRVLRGSRDLGAAMADTPRT